mmetsp:Transcript_9752/g.12353  ORF Transcript_9752/g.12353 Transcript_9752/m.12353 type:complete len:437 (+) Transcript_9752:320-1630(+)
MIHIFKVPVIALIMISSFISSFKSTLSFIPKRQVHRHNRFFSPLIFTSGTEFSNFATQQNKHHHHLHRQLLKESKYQNQFLSTGVSVSLAGAVASTMAITNDESNKNNTIFCANGSNNNASKILEEFPEETLYHDTYNGITLDTSKLSDEYISDPSQFSSILEKSIEMWTSNEKRGIWINIPSKHSAIVPYCTDLGFEFQYAKNGLLVMTKWLPTDQESRLPHGPTHQVGVGVVVVHPTTGKILVVQEKTGPAAARKLWKMPTGLTDPGEDIIDAAVREAKEETGLECIFDKILCIRQAHGGIFGQSDMFFVCSLKLSSKYNLEEEIPLVPQEEEIELISWMDVKDYANQGLWNESPLYQELNSVLFQAVASANRNDDTSSSTSTSTSTTTTSITAAGTNSKKNHQQEQKSECGLIAKTLPLGFRPGEQTIYTSRL